MIPVFIPSKGRTSTKTYKLFSADHFKVFHFIEPQEVRSYQDAGIKNIINILKNDQGIGYVRNYMLEFAKSQSFEWVIVCDDDVTGFGIYNGKTIKTGSEIWLEIYNKAIKLPFELVGINYTQHAWHEKTAYSINKKFAEVCIMVNVSKIKWKYRPEFNLKEDRDFALQTIKNGNGILRFNHYWFACPNVGTNKGGLQDQYKMKKDEESAKKMINEWHPFISLKDKDGRLDIKVDIKGLASHYKKTVK